MELAARIIDRTDPEQEKEWRSIRGLGSSNAGAILNVDKWDTPYSLWELKTRRRDYKAATPWMQRGIDQEAKALQEFCFEQGIDFIKTCMIHNDYPFIRAEFDGWNQTLNYGVEIKVPGEKSEDLQLAKDGIIPPHYIPRLTHLLMITGSDKVAYYTYNEVLGGITLWYYRDEKAIDKLLKAELEFWDCVKTDTPPPLTLRDFVVREDEEWQNYALQFKHFQGILEQAEKQRDEAQQKLIELAKGQSTLGSGVKVLVYNKKGTIQYKKVVDELCDIMGEQLPDLEKFRTEGSTITKVSYV